MLATSIKSHIKIWILYARWSHIETEFRFEVSFLKLLCLGSNPRPLVYKSSGLAITLLPFSCFWWNICRKNRTDIIDIASYSRFGKLVSYLRYLWRDDCVDNSKLLRKLCAYHNCVQTSTRYSSFFSRVMCSHFFFNFPRISWLSSSLARNSRDQLNCKYKFISIIFADVWISLFYDYIS